VSVLKQAYAVPSRVLGVFRYLLHTRGQREQLETLVRVLSPESLGLKSDQQSDGDREGVGKDMVEATVTECVAAGLLVETDGGVTFSPTLPAEARNPKTAESLFPVTLTSLFFDPEHDTNHDLGLAMAWYLSLDAYSAPWNWPEVERAMLSSGTKDLLKLNDLRYHMLEDWFCFLGLGWTYSLGEKRLTPDPTHHLRARLGSLFPGPARSRHSLGDVIARLAALSPVFEGGFLREQVPSAKAEDGANRLSTVTALGLLRLRDEGFIELYHESDATTLFLPDGDQDQPFSHAALVRSA
jgi:hypothetical protein